MSFKISVSIRLLLCLFFLQAGWVNHLEAKPVFLEKKVVSPFGSSFPDTLVKGVRYIDAQVLSALLQSPLNYQPIHKTLYIIDKDQKKWEFYENLSYLRIGADVYNLGHPVIRDLNLHLIPLHSLLNVIKHQYSQSFYVIGDSLKTGNPPPTLFSMEANSRQNGALVRLRLTHKTTTEAFYSHPNYVLNLKNSFLSPDILTKQKLAAPLRLVLVNQEKGFVQLSFSLQEKVESIDLEWNDSTNLDIIFRKPLAKRLPSDKPAASSTARTPAAPLATASPSPSPPKTSPSPSVGQVKPLDPDSINSVEADLFATEDTTKKALDSSSKAPQVPDRNKNRALDRGKKMIIIDPGHGGKDPGAVFKGSQEKLITLDVGKLLKDNLESLGYRALLTRAADTFISLADRPKFATHNKGNLFISLHCNAVAQPQKSGHISGYVAYILREGESEEDKALARRENEAMQSQAQAKNIAKTELSSLDWIVLEHELNQYSHQSERFAEKIVQQFDGGKILKHRTGAHQAGFFVLVGAFMPAVLFEMGFITNTNDRNFMDSPQGKKDIAKRLSIAIDQFFKEEIHE